MAGTRGLRTLGEEDLFAYLCMHGALHWWHRLKWLADINALLVASGSDVERLIGSAKARGAGRAAAQALRICQRLLGTPLPDQFMASLGRGALERWLETTALNVMTKGQGEDDPHEARFGTTRGSLSTFSLSRNWRYWLAETGPPHDEPGRRLDGPAARTAAVPLSDLAAATLGLASRQTKIMVAERRSILQAHEENAGPGLARIRRHFAKERSVCDHVSRRS